MSARGTPSINGRNAATPSLDGDVRAEDKKAGKLKFKKAVGKPIYKPGNWKDGGDETKTEQASGTTFQLVNRLDPSIASMFKAPSALSDDLDLMQCKQCKKPVPRPNVLEHVKSCQRKKQEKQQRKKEAKEAKDKEARRAQGLDDDDDNKTKSANKATMRNGDDDSVNGTAKKSKKRKAGDDGNDGKAKKKKKDEAKAKAPKAKGPVDVEKQCGVPLPNGQMCARSLTCKSHSMGAKRAVPGRSLPYDMLLAQYQKKNQAKQQRAAIDAATGSYNPDDLDLHTGPVDSEEEKEQVMGAIARARPQPLVPQRAFTYTRAKYSRIRMKEALQNALGGNRGAGLFSTSAGQGLGIFGATLDTNVRSINMGGGLNSAVSETSGFHDGMSSSRRPSIVLSAGGQRQNIAAGMAGPSAAARKPSLSAQSVASVT